LGAFSCICWLLFLFFHLLYMCLSLGQEACPPCYLGVFLKIRWLFFSSFLLYCVHC
jgi:hypothetical protein